ncbi:hypothetical protein, partial [Bacteroides thetaiotaomicron]|uniref:hypothetical protein n=1 Tax=Bacteroides thetaiotaomicron TaxID=818 RepID=UPI001A9370E8
PSSPERTKPRSKDRGFSEADLSALELSEDVDQVSDSASSLCERLKQGEDVFQAGGKRNDGVHMKTPLKD